MSCLLSACCCLAAEPDEAEEPPTPESLLKTLDPFYKQHTVAGELLIVCSEKVSKHALLEARYLAEHMLAKRPDVLKTLNDRRMYFCIMAYTEMQNDLPECRNMSDWWAFRCRGVGGRASSCGEENLLCFDGDPWKGENIFLHEFAHAIQGIVGSLDKDFNDRFMAEFNKAKESGRIRGYCINGGSPEFWAEGVQAWFNCNGAIRPKSGGGQSSFEVVGPNGEHVCHLRTREQVTKQANYNGNYIYGKGVKGENIEAPVVAGSLPANAWGLHEMHGNLAEICSTPYDKYTAEAKADPTGPEKGGNHKVLRGGSWRSYPGAIRSSFRLCGNGGSYNVGFRVISPLPEPKEEEKKE